MSPAVVHPSGATTADDPGPLLRRRLRFLALIFALMYAVAILLLIWQVPVAAWGVGRWTFLPAFIIVSVLAGVVWSPWPLSLRQLRSLELGLFATLAARLAFRAYTAIWEQSTMSRAMHWLESDQEHLAAAALAGAAHQINQFATLCIVAYAVFIPNTWHRCVLVVSAFGCIPLAVWAAGCAAHDVPAWYWYSSHVVGSFIMLAVASAMSVYGSHRIETLRRESLQARRLGQYVLRKQLGAGGMGEVYLADHLLLRRPCAIKLIHPERAGDPAVLKRFEREVQATATLTHPNTVQIFDYGRARDGTFYYAMEYLPGLTLDELVRQHGPLPPARAVHFLRQVCAALREAHARQLIHRDLKPGNVMVCERGGVHDVVKLLDFGLVLPPADDPDGEKITRDGAFTGTPAYVSPEQAGGQEADARSDIYGLGAVAYFILTGQPPFSGRSVVQVLAAHLYEEPVPLSTRRPDVPASLEKIVRCCLAKDPNARFSDVGSLDRALAGNGSGESWTEGDAARWWAAENQLIAADIGGQKG